MESHSTCKQKKVKGVRQKLKLFRANEPLKSVLMWGVNYSFSQLNHVKSRAMLLKDDFKAYIKVKVINHLFNKENMPSRFKFKEYCPLVFQNLRDRFCIDKADYWDSFTKRQPVWDSAKGKSGSKFLLTYNRHYVIKTISSEEVEEMHHILESYHEYIVNCHGQTLLPQYLGMYRLTVNDQETYCLVMRNVFSPRLTIHKKYDLKGSTVDREANEKERSKPLPTLKDVDFVNDACKITVGEDAKAKIMQTLENDVQFLQHNNLMDYSLLVGIHDPDQLDASFLPGQGAEEEEAGISPGEEDELMLSDGGERGILVGGPDGEAIVLPTGNTGTSHPVAPLSDIWLRFHRPSGNITPPDSPETVSFPPPPFMGELHPGMEYYGIKSSPKSEKPLIYFLALIDVLCRYGMRKRTAQTYKTVMHGAGAEISTVKPDVYARRFIDFINQCLE